MPDYYIFTTNSRYEGDLVSAYFMKKEQNDMEKENILTPDNRVVEKNRMKRFINRVRKNIIPAVSGVITMTAIECTNVMAADTSSVTKPLDNLKTLVIAIIGAIGVIILAKNVMEFAQAYQQQDSSTMNSALKGIVAGVMMAGISSVLGILGF